VALLWRGIAEYIQRTETKVLFGCGSIKTMDPLESGLITKYLTDEGVLSKEFGVTPTKKYKMRQLDRVLEYIEANPFVYDKSEVAKLIPALFNSYIRMGAKVAGEPALDRDFHCIDFLTVLPMDQLNAVFKDKYKV
ncbi:MAG: GNAT family N-acetyltransferase, partial [Bdellovibrionota bacterium]